MGFKNFKIGLFIPLILLINVSTMSQTKQIDRQPAVAGQFYPADQTELRSMLKDMFSQAAAQKKYNDIAAVISPHAGYVFSGEVAASAFNQINPEREYDNIFIIGSSHRIAFEGASIYRKGNFITPLGAVKVNKDIADTLIKNYNFFSDREDAHSREHSLEVQIPFLQYRLKKAIRIVPIVIGTNSVETCKKIATALRPYLNANNLFVISTDFSHYPSYNDAIKVDRSTADAIISNSAMKLLETLDNNAKKGVENLSTSLCGWTSVLTLLFMTESNPAVSMNIIQYKNSGDAEIGEKSRVVGYYAISVTLKEKVKEKDFNLNENDKQFLLHIARKTIEYYLKNKKIDDVDIKNLSENVKVNCGAFVTLNKNNQLRGCIGRFDASDNLYKIIQQMAIAAATEDYRFQPVVPEELNEIDLEISVLTPMKKINSIDEIELGRHGIYIRKGNRSGTFLPKVATETGWTKEEFLGHCARDKAGIGWDGWKNAEIFVYEALVFSEKRLK